MREFYTLQYLYNHSAKDFYELLNLLLIAVAELVAGGADKNAIVIKVNGKEAYHKFVVEQTKLFKTED